MAAPAPALPHSNRSGPNALTHAAPRPRAAHQAATTPQDGSYDLSAPPPFSLADIRNAIPAHCWAKDTWRSMAYLALDVGIVTALAVGAYTLNAW